jgi:hypothetical protein
VPRLPRGRLPSHAVCVALVKCSISVEHTGMSFSWLRKIIDFPVFSSGVYRSARHTFDCGAEAMTFLS